MPHADQQDSDQRGTDHAAGQGQRGGGRVAGQRHAKRGDDGKRDGGENPGDGQGDAGLPGVGTAPAEVTEGISRRDGRAHHRNRDRDRVRVIGGSQHRAQGQPRPRGPQQQPLKLPERRHGHELGRDADQDPAHPGTGQDPEALVHHSPLGPDRRPGTGRDGHDRHYLGDAHPAAAQQPGGRRPHRRRACPRDHYPAQAKPTPPRPAAQPSPQGGPRSSCTSTSHPSPPIHPPGRRTPTPLLAAPGRWAQGQPASPSQRCPDLQAGAARGRGDQPDLRVMNAASSTPDRRPGEQSHRGARGATTHRIGGCAGYAR